MQQEQDIGKPVLSQQWSTCKVTLNKKQKKQKQNKTKNKTNKQKTHKKNKTKTKQQVMFYLIFTNLVSK